MKRPFILPVLILTLFAASSVSGEVREGAVNSSIFFGGYTFDGVQHLSTDETQGARLGYNLTKNLGMEGQFAYTQLKSSLPAVTTRGEQYSLRGDLLYHFMPDSPVVPFVALGGGWTKIRRVGKDNEDATLDYGAGVKYSINDWLALRSDVRHIFSFHTANARDTAYWQNYEYTAGLNFQFGGKRAATKAIEPEKAVQKAVAAPVAAQGAQTGPIQYAGKRGEASAIEEKKPLNMANAQPVTTKSSQSTPPVAALAPIPPAIQTATTSTTGDNCQFRPVANVVIGKDNVEIVSDPGFENYKVFKLTNPSRLVIDVYCATYGTDDKTARVAINRWGISKMRIGHHPDKLRITFESPLSKLPNYKLAKTAEGIKVLFGK